jgi:epoxide hydrolase-like predicted phosphatase
MLRAGIFDIGGVLQIQEVNEPLRKDVANTFNVTEDEFEKFRLEMEPLLIVGAIDEKQYWEEFIKRTRIKEPIPEESILAREYIKNFTGTSPEVLQIIKKLKANGIRLACLTDTIKPHTEFNLTHGIYDEFEVKIFSHEVRMKKPDPNIYKLALEQLGFKAEGTFFVDDRETNIKAAKDVGITPILFQNPQQLEKELLNLGVLKA